MFAVISKVRLVQISVVNWASVWIRMKNEAPRGCGRHHCLQIIKDENRGKKNLHSSRIDRLLDGRVVGGLAGAPLGT